MIRDMDKNLEESNEYSFASMTKVQVKAIQYAPSLFWEQRLNASCPRINATSVERTNIQADSTKVRPKAKNRTNEKKTRTFCYLCISYLLYERDREEKMCIFQCMRLFEHMHAACIGLLLAPFTRCCAAENVYILWEKRSSIGRQCN